MYAEFISSSAPARIPPPLALQTTRPNGTARALTPYVLLKERWMALYHRLPAPAPLSTWGVLARHHCHHDGAGPPLEPYSTHLWIGMPSQQHPPHFILFYSFLIGQLTVLSWLLEHLSWKSTLFLFFVYSTFIFVPIRSQACYK
jgi:hypothetical protein